MRVGPGLPDHPHAIADRELHLLRLLLGVHGGALHQILSIVLAHPVFGEGLFQAPHRHSGRRVRREVVVFQLANDVPHVQETLRLLEGVHGFAHLFQQRGGLSGTRADAPIGLEDEPHQDVDHQNAHQAQVREMPEVSENLEPNFEALHIVHADATAPAEEQGGDQRVEALHLGAEEHHPAQGEAGKHQRKCEGEVSDIHRGVRDRLDHNVQPIIGSEGFEELEHEYKKVAQDHPACNPVSLRSFLRQIEDIRHLLLKLKSVDNSVELMALEVGLVGKDRKVQGVRGQGGQKLREASHSENKVQPEAHSGDAEAYGKPIHHIPECQIVLDSVQAVHCRGDGFLQLTVENSPEH
mmetsp:Transcript_136065/g.322468  ORF Transcript_136065/g.322468 Transcript_136065/m.322468 type:complete len:353 (+) Transcript_136065:874-1932(+)